MPTFTHNRVKNGFNGKQYSNMHPGNLFQRKRVSSNPANGKFASNVATGRSFAAKRAIARRVARQMPVKPLGEEGRRDEDGNIILNECCMLPTVTISRPVQKYGKGSSSGSSSGSVVSTVTGTWTANSPIDILVNIEVDGNITDNILTVSVNWGGEATETYTFNAGIHLLSHDFQSSGDKNISISYVAGNGLEDNVKFGFKYGATDDELSDSIKNTLNEIVDISKGTTRRDNLYTSLKSLGELPETYTLFKGAFKGASNLSGINVAKVKLESDLTEAFAGTNLQTIPGIDEWGDKMLSVTSLEGFCKDCKVLDDPNIGKLKTENVQNFTSMFEGALSFNQQFDEDLFKTVNATLMSNMFKGASSFDQNISKWDTRNVTNMNGMFVDANEFTKEYIISWTTEKAKAMLNNPNDFFYSMFGYNIDTNSNSTNDNIARTNNNQTILDIEIDAEHIHYSESLSSYIYYSLNIQVPFLYFTSENPEDAWRITHNENETVSYLEYHTRDINTKIKIQNLIPKINNNVVGTLVRVEILDRSEDNVDDIYSIYFKFNIALTSTFTLTLINTFTSNNIIDISGNMNYDKPLYIYNTSNISDILEYQALENPTDAWRIMHNEDQSESYLEYYTTDLNTKDKIQNLIPKIKATVDGTEYIVTGTYDNVETIDRGGLINIYNIRFKFEITLTSTFTLTLTLQ